MQMSMASSPIDRLRLACIALLLNHHVERIALPQKRVVGLADQESLDHMDTPIGQLLPENAWLIGAVVPSCFLVTWIWARSALRWSWASLVMA